MKRRQRKWLALAVVVVGVAARQVPSATAQNAPAVPSQSAEDKRACIKNLKAIYDAIQAYQNDHHDLPNWLSDLVPKYLDDPNVLVCPVARRTGQTESPPLADPKLPISYLYEFCPVRLGNLVTNAPNRTRRDWKRRQMGLLGSQVPIVRCRFHKPVLNLAFDGRVYESPASWELLFTNRVSAEDLTPARMFADVRPPSATEGKQTPAGPRFLARSPKAGKELIDLTQFYNLGLKESWGRNRAYSLASLPDGLQKFGGVQFDVRGLVLLGSRAPASTNRPVAVYSIPVLQKCRLLNFLHAAAFGNVEEDGNLVGTYLVHLGNSETVVKIPIRYGHEVRDYHTLADEPGATADLQVAWTGRKPFGKTGTRYPRLFLTTWTNPAPDQEIDSIDFVSGVEMAAPFLVAITAQ